MPFIGNKPTSVPLTSSDITDSIISLPKLTDGTDGNLISYDASGNPVAVATGTDGQVLTSTGAGSPPAFETLPTNTPAFSAYSTTPQSVSSGTFTKVVFDVEDYDTDNAYDNATNYRFTVPSGAAGKYLVKARLNFRSTSDNITYGLVAIYKNGVKFQQVLSNSNGISNAAFRDFTVSNEHGMILEVSDYIEIFGYAVGTSPIFSHDALRYSLFQMEKIIE